MEQGILCGDIFIRLRLLLQIKWDMQQPSPTIKDFDNKVSEADAYLQLMIDQTKVGIIS